MPGPMNCTRCPPVLHACPVWLPQTQTWMYYQVAPLQRLGVDAHVVCERTENLAQFGIPNIHCLTDEMPLKHLWQRAVRKLGLRTHLPFVAEVGRKIRAAVVHSHFGNIGWANMGAAREIGARHVVTFYGVDVNKLPARVPVWRNRYDDLFACADAILCEGPRMADSIEGLGCPRDKLRVHHLGVALDVLEFRERTWEPGSPLRILIAASFREKKGIPYAVEAVGRLSADYPVELTIIGDAGAEPESMREKARILDSISRTGLGHAVRMLGYRSHETFLREALAHHIFLHPSVTAGDRDCEGGAPVAIIEALATGMLVVATRHCDIPHVVDSRLHRMLAPERDAAALYAILKNVAQQRSEWHRWAAIGRMRVESEFDCARQAERLARIYLELLESASPVEGRTA